MLALARLGDEAYGVTIRREIRGPDRPHDRHRRGLRHAGAARREKPRAVPHLGSAAGAGRTGPEVFHADGGGNARAPALDGDAGADDGRALARIPGRSSVSRPSPPRLAAALVRLLPAERNGPFLAADLAQEFDDLAAAEGLAAARRWYWKQAWWVIAPTVAPAIIVAVRRELTAMEATNRELRAVSCELSAVSCERAAERLGEAWPRCPAVLPAARGCGRRRS